jgi:osmotically-inducible protein OsmY
MNIVKPVHAFVVSSIVLGLFPICAAAKDCANSCTTDETITSEVLASYHQHAELAIPNAIRVQTHNQVVYLYGHVSTGLQRADAVSLAQQVPNVKRVIDSIRTNSAGG